MAKSKTQIDKLKAHFFMSVDNGSVHTIYDDGDDKVILAAAFASAMIENTHLFDIISTAFLTLLDEKQNITSKKKKTNPKQSVPKGASEGKPFVKTRKKAVK